jgi:hypothetical protein
MHVFIVEILPLYDKKSQTVWSPPPYFNSRRLFQRFLYQEWAHGSLPDRSGKGSDLTSYPNVPALYQEWTHGSLPDRSGKGSDLTGYPNIPAVYQEWAHGSLPDRSGKGSDLTSYPNIPALYQ